MKDEFDRINSKLDNLDSRLSKMSETLIINTEQLAYHIRRTDMLEEDLKPVRTHVQQMRGAAKLIFLISLLASIFLVFK